MRAVPILGESHTAPPYALLTGQNAEKVTVTEVDESGTVPELTVRNTLDVAVYLMDGQELIGAKQNRILNTDVVVDAHTTLKIPVNCVEAGRWGYNSPQFSPGKSAAYRTRCRKSAQVHASLKSDLGHHSDQSATWNEVAACLSESKVQSRSSSLSDAYVARRRDMERDRASLKLPEDAVGLAMFRDEKFLGLDLFDRHTTMAYFWESLLDSYLIESVERPYDPHQQEREADGNDDGLSAKVAEVLEKASAGTWEDFDSPGLGRDHRLEDESFSGSGLVLDEKVVVHLQLFPKTDGGEGEREQRAYRPRLHRRYVRQPRPASPEASAEAPREDTGDAEGDA